jgi:hypothetical protein
MVRVGSLLEQYLASDRRYVYVDCVSKRTGTEWCHRVHEDEAESTVRSIERRWPDVKATVRR